MDEELGTYETSEELSPEIQTHMEKLREFVVFVENLGLLELGIPFLKKNTVMFSQRFMEQM